MKSINKKNVAIAVLFSLLIFLCQSTEMQAMKGDDKDNNNNRKRKFEEKYSTGDNSQQPKKRLNFSDLSTSLNSFSSCLSNLINTGTEVIGQDLKRRALDLKQKAQMAYVLAPLALPVIKQRARALAQDTWQGLGEMVASSTGVTRDVKVSVGDVKQIRQLDSFFLTNAEKMLNQIRQTPPGTIVELNNYQQDLERLTNSINAYVVAVDDLLAEDEVNNEFEEYQNSTSYFIGAIGFEIEKNKRAMNLDVD